MSLNDIMHLMRNIFCDFIEHHKSFYMKVRDLKKIKENEEIRVLDKSLTLHIKSEQDELSDTQNSVLFSFLSHPPSF